MPTSSLSRTHASDRSLADAVDRGLLYAHEHQLHFASLVGSTPRWRLHPERGTARFDGRHGLECDVQIIGVDKAGTWEWAWASSNVTGARQLLADSVYQAGVRQELAVFTTGRLTLTAGDARRLVVGAATVHQRWTAFAFTVDGMIMHAALGHPALSLPAPTAGTVRHTLNPDTWQVAPVDARRAVRDYATLRHLTRQERRDRTAIRLSAGTGWTVTTHFASDGTLTNTSID